VQGRWRGVTVGCAVAREPGLATAASTGTGGRLGRGTADRGDALQALLIAAMWPTCDAGKSEGE
jgi:hypothetical protein